MDDGSLLARESGPEQSLMQKEDLQPDQQPNRSGCVDENELERINRECEDRISAADQKIAKLEQEVKETRDKLSSVTQGLEQPNMADQRLKDEVSIMKKLLEEEKNRTKLVILEIIQFEREIGKILKDYFPQIDERIEEAKKDEAYQIVEHFINAFESAYDQVQDTWVNLNETKELPKPNVPIRGVAGSEDKVVCQRDDPKKKKPVFSEEFAKGMEEMTGAVVVTARRGRFCNQNGICTWQDETPGMTCDSDTGGTCFDLPGGGCKIERKAAMCKEKKCKCQEGLVDETEMKFEIADTVDKEKKARVDCTIPKSSYAAFEVKLPVRGYSALKLKKELLGKQRRNSSNFAVPDVFLKNLVNTMREQICDTKDWEQEEAEYCRRKPTDEDCDKDCEWRDGACKSAFTNRSIASVIGVMETVGRHLGDRSSASSFLDAAELKEMVKECVITLQKGPNRKVQAVTAAEKTLVKEEASKMRDEELRKQQKKLREEEEELQRQRSQREKEKRKKILSLENGTAARTVKNLSEEVQDLKVQKVDNAKVGSALVETWQRSYREDADYLVKFPQKYSLVDTDRLKGYNDPVFEKVAEKGLSLTNQVKYTTAMMPTTPADLELDSEWRARFWDEEKKEAVACINGITDEGLSVSRAPCSSGFSLLEEARDLVSNREALVSTMRNYLDFAEWIDAIHDEHFPTIKRMVEDFKDSEALLNVESAIELCQTTLSSWLTSSDESSASGKQWKWSLGDLDKIEKAKDDIYREANCKKQEQQSCNGDCEWDRETKQCSDGLITELVEALKNVAQSVSETMAMATNTSEHIAKAENSSAKISIINADFPQLYFQVDDMAESAIPMYEDMVAKDQMTKAERFKGYLNGACEKMREIMKKREEFMESMEEHCKWMGKMNCFKSSLCERKEDDCHVKASEIQNIVLKERFQDVKGHMESDVKKCEKYIEHLDSQKQAHVVLKDGNTFIIKMREKYGAWNTAYWMDDSLNWTFSHMKEATEEVGKLKPAVKTEEIESITEKAQKAVIWMRRATEDWEAISKASGLVMKRTPSKKLLEDLLNALGKVRDDGAGIRRRLLAVFRAQQAFSVVRSLRHLTWKVHKWRIVAFDGQASKDAAQQVAEELDKTYSPKMKKLGPKVNAMFGEEENAKAEGLVAEVVKTAVGAKSLVDTLKTKCPEGSSCEDFTKHVPAADVLSEVKQFEGNLMKTLFRQLRLEAHEFQSLIGKVDILLDLKIANADATLAGSETNAANTEKGTSGATERKGIFSHMKEKVETFKQALDDMVTTLDEALHPKNMKMNLSEQELLGLLTKLKEQVKKMGSLAGFEELTRSLKPLELNPQERDEWKGPAEIVKMLYVMRETQIAQPLNTLLEALGREIGAPIEGGGQ